MTALLDKSVWQRDIDTLLREEARLSVSHAPILEPLKRFALVGCPNWNLNESNADSARFIQIFRYLIKTGIPIDPDFTIDAIDLENGRNYLHEKSNKADVTLVSYVPLYSHDDALDKQWKKCLTASDSKIIFSICLGDEVNLNIHAPHHFRPLGKAQPYDADDTLCKDIFAFRSSSELIHARDLLGMTPSWNTGRWQVAGHEDFIETMAPHAHGKTQLGKSIFQQAVQLGKENHRRRQLVSASSLPRARHES